MSKLPDVLIGNAPKASGLRGRGSVWRREGAGSADGICAQTTHRAQELEAAAVAFGTYIGDRLTL